MVISVCETFKSKEAHAKYRNGEEESVTSFGSNGWWTLPRKVELWARCLKMSKNDQINNRKNGGGVVGKNIEGNNIYNKGMGQFYYRSLGNMWPDI